MFCLGLEGPNLEISVTQLGLGARSTEGRRARQDPWQAVSGWVPQPGAGHRHFPGGPRERGLETRLPTAAWCQARQGENLKTPPPFWAPKTYAKIKWWHETGFHCGT